MSDIPPPLLEMGTLLSEIQLDVEAMIFGELEGLIAGVIVLPKPVPNEEWLPLIWREEESAFPDDPQKAARFVELVLARKTEVIGDFLAGDTAYDPVFELDIDDSFLWECWLDGFLQAIALQPDAPRQWKASDNEDLATAAWGMQRLIQIYNRDKLPKKIVTELSDFGADLVGYYAETLYRCQRGMKRSLLA